MDNTRIELIQCLRTHNWEQIPKVCATLNENDPLYQTSVQFYQATKYNHGKIAQFGSNLIKSNDWIVKFLFALTQMVLGNGKVLKAYKISKKKDQPDWTLDWLRFDDLIRRQRYHDAFNHLNRVVRKDANEWISTAIIHANDTSKLTWRLTSDLVNLDQITKSPAKDKITIRLKGPGLTRVMKEELPYAGQYFLSNGNLKNANKALTLAIEHCEYKLSHINDMLGLLAASPDTERLLTVAKQIKASTRNITGSHINETLDAITLTHFWRKGDIQNAFNLASNLIEFSTLNTHDNSINPMVKNAVIYSRYVTKLIASINGYESLYGKHNNLNKLFVIGESHSLSPSNRKIIWNCEQVKAEGLLIMGVKMHHLSCQNKTAEAMQFKTLFETAIEALDETDHVLLTIGEIDCRTDEGIWHEFQKNHTKNLNDLISNTVKNYITYIADIFAKKRLSKITLQGVPAPLRNISDLSHSDKKEYLDMFQIVNEDLKFSAISMNWNFLDVYSATVNDVKTSNKKWHIDDSHLKPSFYDNASHYLIS